MSDSYSCVSLRQLRDKCDVVRLLATLRATSFVAAMGAIVLHSISHQYYGKNTCNNILEAGNFINSEWIAKDCHFHRYSNSDSYACAEKKSTDVQKWGFIGFNSTKKLFEAFVHQISSPNSSHKNFYQRAKFVWGPHLFQLEETLFGWQEDAVSPDVIVIEIDPNEVYNPAFERSLERIIPDISLLTSTGRTLIWRLPPAGKTASNANDQEIIVKILQNTDVHIWTTPHATVKDESEHLKESVNILLNYACNHMNLFLDGTCCNSTGAIKLYHLIALVLMAFCFLGFSYVIYLITLKSNVKIFHKKESRSATQPELVKINVDPNELIKKDATELPCKESPINKEKQEKKRLVISIFKMAAIMLYFYLCDRTNHFIREDKTVSTMYFGVLFIGSTVIGCLTIKKSNTQIFLNRNITDEWKGWMQLAILFYHFTGMSKILPIYMHIRILVSAYLFLTGYGHFSYYWTGKPMSFTRYFQVMFRMNFLVILLCIVMHRPYQFYYFVPLVSFWFSLMYLALALPPYLVSGNDVQKSPPQEIFRQNCFIGLQKIVVLIIMSFVLHLSEMFFSRLFLFEVWEFLFENPEGEVHEWYFRWGLDRFSIMYGMLLSLGYNIYTSVNDQRNSGKEPASNGNTTSKDINKTGMRTGFNLFSTFGTVVLSLAFLCSYFGLLATCHSKPSCNAIHPYLTWMPIIGFVMLRNLPVFRKYYSEFLAWIGKFSLELFVSQYHIWLALDTYGILIFLPGNYWLNLFFITIVFIAICLEIHICTEVVATSVCPKDTRICLRNLVIIISFISCVVIYSKFG